jgi:MYXO-CTERM domain-containing protein
VKAFVIGSLTALLAASSLVQGATISTSLGNTTSALVNGAVQSTASVNTAQTGQPAPFTGNCGSDASANCSANWTFSYTISSGQTITAATLLLGIWDIDSGAPGNQVASYKLTGGDDLTGLLNTVSEALNAGTGSKNSEYDILSVSIPSTSFAQLAGGTANIVLALQGPGLGVLSPTTNPAFNGAKLVFSTLNIDTTEVTTTPEPSYFALVPMALGALAFVRRRRKSC